VVTKGVVGVVKTTSYKTILVNTVLKSPPIKWSVETGSNPLLQVRVQSLSTKEITMAGLTKLGKVGEILALCRLKSLSLDCKAKLKSPCFFLQVTFLANNLRFMIKLIDKAIVINGKIHRNKRKRFYSSNKKV
jgi:hypothetical protein